SLFLELRARVAGQATILTQIARAIAELDALQSFARVARRQGYRRPTFNAHGRLKIQEGRHPVVETLLAPGAFVPNGVELCPDTARTLILTGPNMGGKSTIMRQVALISV